ncbi:MAG: hypothetical protein JST30_07755 [Armatimonadetes bacterium]|nr:hypothetical protein [Armatimonadota bacterium]
MGTTIPDLMDPEFVLLGSEDHDILELMQTLYGSLHGRPMFCTTVCTAELIKVAYNTFIGMKVVFANTMMEVSEHVGADVDDVTAALSLATKRLLSPKYMRADMGDGGGCHPRDNIAMSYLARQLGLSFDIFEAIMAARGRQTEWIANLAVAESRNRDLAIVVLGKAYKPETNLTVGSPAVLLANLIAAQGGAVAAYDPFTDGEATDVFVKSAVFVLGTNHEAFHAVKFPEGSVVIDPWRAICAQQGVALVSIGRG